MPRRSTLLANCVLLYAIAFSLCARAQEDALEDILNRRSAGANVAELQEQVKAAPPSTDDKQELCVFYHRRGLANYALGNYTAAIQDFRVALQSNQPSRLTPQNLGDRWRIQIDLGNALREAGDEFAQVEHWRSVAREYRQRNGISAHFAYARLVRPLLRLADFAEAEQALHEAGVIVNELRNSRAWAREGYRILYSDSIANALVKVAQGELADAERLRRLALDYAQKHLEQNRRSFASEHLGLRGAVETAAWAKLYLSDVLAARGKYGEAESFARDALDDWLRVVGFETGQVSYALGIIGNAKLQQQNLDAAQRYHRHAISALERSGAAPHSPDLAGRRAALANVFVIQGRWQEALKVFDERDRGLRSDAQQFARFGSAHIGWVLALLKTGDAERAARMIEAKLAHDQKYAQRDKQVLAQLRGVKGMVQQALGNREEALRAFQEAVPELVRRGEGGAENVGTRDAFWRRIILESYIELLADMQAAGAAPAGLDVADLTFRLADFARGSSVQEAISASAARAQLPDDKLAELVRRDQDALNRVDALNKALGRLAAAPGAERLNKVIGDMEREIERSHKEHSANIAEIRKRFPEYAELIDPQPPGIAALRRILSPAEVLISIYSGETQAYVWTVGARGKPAFRVVPIARTEVEADVAKLRRALELGDVPVAQLPQFNIAIAAKLYRLFLGPDEVLWKDARILNIIPHGALGQLPFGLLVTAPTDAQAASGAQNTYQSAAWLVRKAAIAQLPSASAFSALRRAPAAKASRLAFFGIGDPVFRAEAGNLASNRGGVRNLKVAKGVDTSEERLDAAAQGSHPQNQPPQPVATLSLAAAFDLLSPLPDTAQELNETALSLGADAAHDVYVGRRASETNVKHARLDDRRVVAFATHGIAPGELAALDQPALALSNPALTGEKGEDGFLTMEEVLGLKLDADWVVLSACNTASADGKAAEAVSGLGRAFFYAGARSLLVSNWAVETTSARMLTTELFRQQAQNPALTRAEALRASMLALMDKPTQNGQSNFGYSHPVFWAPFSLVGDSGGASTAR